jgi:tetratricopeptide (TPR) repeat protein
MPPKNSPQNDSKLLLAVAGMVVAGAVGVALVAGLTVQPDQAPPETAKDRVTSPAKKRTIAERDWAQPSVSLESTSKPVPAMETRPLDEDVARTVESITEAFVIDPEADPWSEGSRAYHERDYVRAAAYFRADAEARPDRAYTHYMLGLALWKSGELDGALEAMERSAAVNDQSIKTFINLARIHNARGEFDGARVASERALTIDGENPTALYQLARSQYNLGRADEAIATLESCIELDQAAAEAHNLLGLVHLQRGDDSGALRSFETAAALKPEVAYIQNNLGLALEQSGRLEEAVMALRRAVEIDENHQAATVSLARIEARLPLETVDGAPAVELAEARPGEAVMPEVDGPQPAPVDESNEETSSAGKDDSQTGGESSD